VSNSVAWLVDRLVTHLVALGFVAFVCVAVIWRGPVFGLSDAGANTVSASTSVAVVKKAPESNLPAPVVEESAIQAESSVVSSDIVPEQTSADSVFRPATQVVESKVLDQTVSGPDVPLVKMAESRIEPQPMALSEKQVVKLLHEARAAFWEGSLESAESLYLRYLKQRPGDANGFGELGNLFQSMGRTSDALDAYFEAGVRFKSLGDTKQLDQILELLDETKDPRALELRN